MCLCDILEKRDLGGKPSGFEDWIYCYTDNLIFGIFECRED